MTGKPEQQERELIRGVGLWGATTLNTIEMIGVGPFITIPLIVAAAGGPQAMLGWIAGAVLAACDGLIWAELGASMPKSGGSYRYLNEIYGPQRWGRLMSFLYVWQLSFSAPLSAASGLTGLAQYAGYIWPSLDKVWWSRNLGFNIPFAGEFGARVVLSPGRLLAIGFCILAVLLLYRKISVVARISELLWVGVAATLAWIIFAGLTNFSAARALSFPPGAFTLNHEFFTGMGAALLVATYDYWGYYNVNFFGAEVKDPTRNIPRSLLISIAVVAFIYIVMNISILGVVPWQEMVQAARTDSRFYIVSTFIERLYGHKAAYVASGLIIWTAFASVLSVMLGASRVPFAAARDGNYFRSFGVVHPEHRMPHVALIAVGVVTALFCLLPLADLIAALVVIRILIQFISQAVGLIILRSTRPDYPRPFRMWLYPVPAVVAICGFLFILFSRRNFGREVRWAVVVLVLGIVVYLLRAWRKKDFPFQSAKELPARTVAL